MANDREWSSLDVHLLRILHTLLLEGSVSRAARKLNVSQPAVSSALKRLRDMTGDKLLVRSRDGMTPTERGAELREPVRIALEQLERIVIGNLDFDPELLTRCFNLATPDYLNPTLIGDVITETRRQAPGMQLKLHSMTHDFDYPRGLELGELDLVIGNWPSPPQHLRTKRLFEDRMVVMMRAGHPLAQRQQVDLNAWLDADHVAPTPYAVGQRGVVDVFLTSQRLLRKVVVYVPYFHLAPYVLLNNDLVFTASARFAEHYARFLPLVTLPAPAELPAISYFLLWHDRSHESPECRWLRDAITEIARR